MNIITIGMNIKTIGMNIITIGMNIITIGMNIITIHVEMKGHNIRYVLLARDRSWFIAAQGINFYKTS